MSSIAGKIWGQTELIHKNGVLEFHRINYKAGFKCSEHKHEFKWNGFFVESGAADGLGLSNSLHFERNRNWTGLFS